MNQQEEYTHRRNVVASMYDNDTWRERVAGMPRDQITAIFLKYMANAFQPRPETPEALDKDMLESKQESYSELRLF